MSSTTPVTVWLGQLKAGNDGAAQELFNHYFPQLVRLARARFRDFPRRARDEEDVALSAFDSFCAGVAAGRFPLLSDSGDLWRLLVTITARKVIEARQHETRQKRGGGKVRGESVFLDGRGEPDQDAGIEQVVGAAPSAEFAARVADEMRHLLEALGGEELRSVAVWKMEGYSNREIAEKLGCVERTVERKLDRIRSTWEALR